MKRTVLTLGLTLSMGAAGCSSGAQPTTQAPGASPTRATADATPAVITSLAPVTVTPAPATDPRPTPGPSATAPPAAAMIPQPVVSDLPVAPESERVDLAVPAFSDPTNITNPLFPVSSQESVLLLGEVDGMAFRTEVTLLPYTRILEWEGQPVATLVSQYVAYLDGRIHEVAYDYYAQADDGSVWYWGEYVFNFAEGAIIDTHGTWIAGIDGPAAMIMPSDPQVGDVYRPENIPGFVFEEVTVRSIGQTVDGPLGPIEGALVVEELHMDGTTEDKTFAPRYGEFFTAGGGDVEALALAVPTDSLAQAMPAELEAVHAAALAIFDLAGSPDWPAAAAGVESVRDAWGAYPAGSVPVLVGPLMADAVDTLVTAVEARDADRARQAAIAVARLSLDLQLRHRPAVEVDLARMELWAAQTLADAAADKPAAVRGDFFSLDYVRDRILGAVSDDEMTRINTQFEALNAAVGDEDMQAVAELGRGLRDIVTGITRASH